MTNNGAVYTKLCSLISEALLTDAGGLVLREARRTFASEASNGVDTQELAVVLLSGTFINICCESKNKVGRSR